MTIPGSPSPLRTILLVEDTESDVFLTRQALSDLNAPVDLHHVEDGRQCLAFLRKESPYESAPTPDLVLLDLNLPSMSGRAVLAAIGADEALRSTPVVILTTSRDETDVREAYRLRCNAYVAKPLDFSHFSEIIEGIWRHWFHVAALPHSRPS